MKLMKCNPHRNLVSLPYEIDRFFNDLGYGLKTSDVMWYPTVDVAETEDAFEMELEIPGLHKSNINVSVRDNVLIVSGEKKREEKKDEKNFHRIERTYGRFERRFHMPKEVKPDEIKAQYRNGVLHVEIPKAEKVKPKEIAVN